MKIKKEAAKFLPQDLQDAINTFVEQYNIIEEYDLEIKKYYQKRTDNKKSMTWSEQMSGLLGREVRLHMRQFLKNRGFEMK